MEAADILGGRYRLEERLGAGGMSVVWRAYDQVLERSVAVKVLSARHAGDLESRARIRAEALAVARLSHPHVASVYDYGDSRLPDGTRVPYVVMEMLDGSSLAELHKGEPLPVWQAVRVCAEVASALAAAHAQGIVHRDVKPGNVMVTPTGAKVVDFGLAAAAGDITQDDPDGIMYGTPAYLAPERLDGGPVVPGTDVYALGLMLYRLLSGALPWTADTTTQMLRAHLYVEPRPLPPIDGVPAEVAALCRRCLAKAPNDRPSAAEVARELSRFAGRPAPPVGTAGRTGAAGATATRGRRLSPAAKAGIAAAAAVVAALGLLAAVPQLLPNADTPQAHAQRPAPGGLPGQPSPGPDPVTGTPSLGGVDPGLPATPGQAPRVTPGNVQPAPNPTSRGDGDPDPVASGSPPVPREATFVTVGGSVRARCTGTSAFLVEWQPAAGYNAKVIQRGPAADVAIRFRTGNQPANVIRVRCVDGAPVSRNQEGNEDGTVP